MIFRRGVSLVVGNALIILLVIVGVASIWAVVKPTISKSAEQIETDCLSVSVEPVSCIVDYSNIADPRVTLTVKRNIGEGNIKDINLIFTGNDWVFTTTSPPLAVYYNVVQTSEFPVIQQISTLNELETNIFSISTIDSLIYGFDSILVDINQLYFNTFISNLPSPSNPHSLISVGFAPLTFNVGAITESNRVCLPLSQPIKCSCITSPITPVVPVDLCSTINS